MDETHSSWKIDLKVLPLCFTCYSLSVQPLIVMCKLYVSASTEVAVCSLQLLSVYMQLDGK